MQSNNNKEKQQILVIDDDIDYCNLVSEVLSEEFDCLTANSGTEALDLFKRDYQPIIALVDLNLPDITGFQVCSQLSKIREKQDFAIFVVSGNDDTETKINAFEHGADDYISKPFEVSELLSRIKRSIKYVEGKNKLRFESANTKSMATIAMAQASQYSYVMNFFKTLNHCQNNEDIAKLFFDTLALFGLQASLVIRSGQDEYFDRNLIDLSPIEKSIYELLKQHGRLYEFGARLMLNGKRASFLVKNLPSDPSKAGEARDFLAALIEGLDAKLSDLEVKSGLVATIGELNETIKHIKTGVQDHNRVISSVMNDMVTEVSSSYHSLDLSEDQELFFTKLVEDSATKMSGTGKLLSAIQIDLEDLKNKIEAVQKASETPSPLPNAPSDDVELF